MRTITQAEAEAMRRTLKEIASFGNPAANLALTAAITDALKRRGVSDLNARVVAELGALASRIAYERWSETTGDEEFGVIARHALDEVQAATLR